MTIKATSFRSVKCRRRGQDCRAIAMDSAQARTGCRSRFSFWVKSTTNIPKTNPYRLVFFACTPQCWRGIRAWPRRALSLLTLHFHPLPRLSVLRSLWWSRERARGHFLYWRGISVDWLWLVTPVAAATETDTGAKNRSEAVSGTGLGAVTRAKRAPASGHSSRWARGSGRSLSQVATI